MRVNKQTVEILMAQKCWGREELLKSADISDCTYYKSFGKGVLPKQVGKIARALGVPPEDIIVKES